jgi:hypothetical protein
MVNYVIVCKQSMMLWIENCLNWGNLMFLFMKICGIIYQGLVMYIL